MHRSKNLGKLDICNCPTPTITVPEMTVQIFLYKHAKCQYGHLSQTVHSRKTVNIRNVPLGGATLSIYFEN